MLDAMETGAGLFYAHAQGGVKHHQWLEFTGFMREYIKICREALHQGIDFQEELPPLEGFHASYIAEKLECIFGDQLKVHYSPNH